LLACAKEKREMFCEYKPAFTTQLFFKMKTFDLVASLLKTNGYEPHKILLMKSFTDTWQTGVWIECSPMEMFDTMNKLEKFIDLQNWKIEPYFNLGEIYITIRK
jgi:hypothetical protein